MSLLTERDLFCCLTLQTFCPYRSKDGSSYPRSNLHRRDHRFDLPARITVAKRFLYRSESPAVVELQYRAADRFNFVKRDEFVQFHLTGTDEFCQMILDGARLNAA